MTPPQTSHSQRVGDDIVRPCGVEHNGALGVVTNQTG
jgi:hypothetical protein